MTRASLLRILDNLGGISETEVQELEQLAAAFPYCQTAHLLLAKAAHDRGSMLAAQRLRRAATYAVDRQRLRTLIELPAPLPPASLGVPADATRVATTPALLEIAPQVAPALIVVEDAPLEVAEVETTTDSFSFEPSIANDDDQNSDLLLVTPEVPETQPATTEEAAAAPQTVSPATEQDLTEASPQPDSAVTFVEEVTDTVPVGEQIPPFELIDSELEASQEPSLLPATVEATPDATAPVILGANFEQEASNDPADQPTVEAANPAHPVPAVDNLTAVPKPAGDELPPEVPPIRPPAEAGSSRFEFGLAETVPAVSSYNLFEVEKAPAKSTFAMLSFWADAEVGYAPGLGSRLGFCLQAQDDYTLDLPPSAFFAPDALLLQHLKQHQPVPPPVPKSIDLIDKFLRSKPRFKAPLPLPPTTEAQADLSVRSTIAEPGLASESLARILARQGKIAKAIEIYERLMVRQPEKKAYFADQIQQLQTFE